jgi:hypothetical protein
MKTTTILLSCLLPVSISQAANIAFLSFHVGDNSPSMAAATAGFTQAPDVGYTAALAAAGHSVTRFLSSAAPDVNTLNSFDLVIISRSVASGNYDGATAPPLWNSSITKPTMILGGYVIRDNRLGYMAGDTIPDVNSATVRLHVNNPIHPIFEGISLDGAGDMVNGYATIQTGPNGAPQRGISVVTGATDAGGTILATVGTAGDAAVNGMVIGEWLGGTSVTRDSTTATPGTDILGGHRLVFLTGSRENAAITGPPAFPALTSEGSGIFDLTPDGKVMFLNAVDYMAVPEPSTYALLALGGLAFATLRRRK